MQASWIEQEAEAISQRFADDYGLLYQSNNLEELASNLLTLIGKDCDSYVSRVTSGGDITLRIEGQGKGKMLLLSSVHGKDDYHNLTLTASSFRTLALEPGLFQELILLVVLDKAGQQHHDLLRGREDLQADYLLAFAPAYKEGEVETAVVARQGLFSLEVEAQGQASIPQRPLQGSLTLDVLATLIKRLAVEIVEEEDEVSVIPDHIQADKEHGRLSCSVQAFNSQTAHNMLAMVPEELKGIVLTTGIEEIYPALPVRDGLAEVLTGASQLIGRSLFGVSRAQPDPITLWSDRVPVIIDGLGLEEQQIISCQPQAEVVLAFALACLYKKIEVQDYVSSFAENLRAQN